MDFFQSGMRKHDFNGISEKKLVERFSWWKVALFTMPCLLPLPLLLTGTDCSIEGNDIWPYNGRSHRGENLQC